MVFHVRLVDLLGSGISGVLWSRDAVSASQDHMYFLDFSNSVKPYVLDTMNNNMGALTRVDYAPSTHFYLADERRRETRWKTTLPFPVQVVARVEVIDQISKGKLSTEYFYRHGAWDGGEREFRGFGRVDQHDTESFSQYSVSGLQPDQPFETVLPKFFSPPTEMRSWFYQGPVGPLHGDWYEIETYSDEYWSHDPQHFERPEELKTMLADLPRRDRRDALRTLRGQVLRTELYALDGSDHEDRPYTVTEAQHTVREESLQNSLADTGISRIFFPHSLAQRTTQWERGDDPMIQFGFTANYDEFGQPTEQTQIACPRGWRTLDDTSAQPFLATKTITEYAIPVDPAVYIVDRVAKTTTFEVLNDGNQTVTELKKLPENSSFLKLFGQTLNYYDGQAFEGLSFGEVANHGIPVRSEILVLTENILKEVYKSGNEVQTPPEVPPYMVPGSQLSASDEYPQSFIDEQSSLAGYVFHDGNQEQARGYYVSAARQKFDFQDSSSQNKPRGLLLATRDPFDQETVIQDYLFDLLPRMVTDPLALSTHADYDLRLLQPATVTDPNGNRSRAEYTPLGLVKHAWIMGKENENLGDTLDAPGTVFDYHLLEFV